MTPVVTCTKTTTLERPGGEIPVFIGSRDQRGHGLGSVLGGLFRRFVIPLFRTHGKTLALDALRTGMDVAEDVLGSGRGLKESVKKRVPEGIKRTAQSLIRQSRSGRKRRKRRARTNDISAWLSRTICPANAQSRNWTGFPFRRLRRAWNRVVGSSIIL